MRLDVRLGGGVEIETSILYLLILFDLIKFVQM